MVNVTALVPLNKEDLNDQAGALPCDPMEEVERGLHDCPASAGNPRCGLGRPYGPRSVGAAQPAVVPDQ